VLSLEGAATIWVIVAIGAAIAELTIPHFGLIFVSGGGFVAALASWAGFSPGIQLAVFCVTVVVSFVVLRPRLMLRLGSRGVPSRTDNVLHREGVVTVDIEPVLGAGRVTVGGEDWAARSTAPIPAGRRVRVVSADGIVLEVVPE
jgi:membrane protein implicated in regulation of membrane protease activity